MESKIQTKLVLENLKKYRIILGSNSPRRKELLKGLDIDFTIRKNNTDESYPKELTGAEIPCYLAEKKAQSYALTAQELLITADTIVWFNNKVYGKPKDKAQAKYILRQLACNTHQVITGVCIRTKAKTTVFDAVSNVRFGQISEEELDYYLDHYQPYDKAGAYGVQEWIGYMAVERIEGSYFNVMGLPIQRLYSELKKF